MAGSGRKWHRINRRDQELGLPRDSDSYLPSCMRRPGFPDLISIDLAEYSAI
jgi:hypothetical protein